MTDPAYDHQQARVRAAIERLLALLPAEHRKVWDGLGLVQGRDAWRVVADALADYLEAHAGELHGGIRQ